MLLLTAILGLSSLSALPEPSALQEEAQSNSAPASTSSQEMIDDEANLARAHAEVIRTQLDVMKSMKALCGHPDSYLKAYAILDPDNRELLKETCAHSDHSKHRKV